MSLLQDDWSASDELPSVSSIKAAKQAQAKVRKYASGEHTLKTRWTNVNQLFTGGFRFGTTYVIGGLSGHGKSYFLNHLMDDFFSLKENRTFPDPIVWLHFGFEMAAASDVLRTASRKLGIPYGDLLSFEKKIDPNIEKKFNEFISTYRPNVHYVEKSGTEDQIFAKIVSLKSKFPGHKIIVSLDHLLLAKESRGQDELKNAVSIAERFIDEKSEDMMVILLSQLNANIESEKRIEKPHMHYPIKNDLHGSNQIFMAADYVAVIHQPQILNIEEYGPQKIPSENLVAIHLIKAREGKIGFARLWNDLDKGTFTLWTQDKLNDYLRESAFSELNFSTQ